MMHRDKSSSTEAVGPTGVFGTIVADESGAELVEWGLLVTLVAVVALVAVAAFGSELVELFERVVDALPA